MKKAQGKRLFWGCLLAFVGVVSWSAAWGDFYVIPVGMKAKRTILVSPKSSPTESGFALRSAMHSIKDNSSANPWLIKIEPGVYDLGGNGLAIKDYVDVEGSGEGVTTIRGSTQGSSVAPCGVIVGGSYAELRHLTVENVGGGGYWSVAILAWEATSFRMTHVTAETLVGSSQPGRSAGIYLYGSSAVLTNVTAYASSGTTYNYGIFSEYLSNVDLINVIAHGTGGNASFGVLNAGNGYYMNVYYSKLWSDYCTSCRCIRNDSQYPVEILFSSLWGPVAPATKLRCSGVDNGSSFYANTCPP